MVTKADIFLKKFLELSIKFEFSNLIYSKSKKNKTVQKWTVLAALIGGVFHRASTC